MADESLIEEMRATLRGDRERAAQRRSSEPELVSAVQAGLLPERNLSLEEAPQLEVKTEPEVARGRLRWLRRRRAFDAVRIRERASTERPANPSAETTMILPQAKRVFVDLESDA